jgi:hypothetical protein
VDEKLDAELEEWVEVTFKAIRFAPTPQGLLRGLLQDLARKVQAIERERCAKVAEAFQAKHARGGPDPWTGGTVAGQSIAAAIRGGADAD